MWIISDGEHKILTEKRGEHFFVFEEHFFVYMGNISSSLGEHFFVFDTAFLPLDAREVYKVRSNILSTTMV